MLGERVENRDLSLIFQVLPGKVGAGKGGKRVLVSYSVCCKILLRPVRTGQGKLVTVRSLGLEREHCAAWALKQVTQALSFGSSLRQRYSLLWELNGSLQGKLITGETKSFAEDLIHS